MKKYVLITGFPVLIFFTLLTAVNLDIFFLKEQKKLFMPKGIFYQVFGQFRHDIAALFYIKSDEYYHRGTEHRFDEKHPGGNKCVEESGEPAQEKSVNILEENNGDIFFKISRALQEHRLVHLEKTERAEVIPWFFFSSEVDPEFIAAYTVGSFWLATRMQKPDEALIFLKKGARYNPRAWQIFEQIGSIYFMAKNDYQKSLSYFKRAYELMSGENQAALIDKKRVLIFLAASAERLNKYEQSLLYNEALLALVPEDEAAKAKIDSLREKIEKGF
ncbi:MAG: tetratricopeptide repeat protein [Candidatus Omnitrophica bacterium]|nr:tetratricopeptide repeat protein [Candidatus Omnitrophota bacterium]